MKKTTKKLTSFAEHLDAQYGKEGAIREAYENGYEAFKLGAMLQMLRKEKDMTQLELAEKCGTTKHYISRIENDASDIRLSTLMRIFQEGFGAQLMLQIKFK